MLRYTKTAVPVYKISVFVHTRTFLSVPVSNITANGIGNKLLDIKPTIGENHSVVRNIRKEENVLVATHHSLYVTSFWNVATLHK